MAEGGWFVEVPQAGPPAEASASFERLYRAFLSARAALGLALVAAQVISSLIATPPAQSTMLLSLSYALAAVALWLLPWCGAFRMSTLSSPNRFSFWSSASKSGSLSSFRSPVSSIEKSP